MRKLIVPGTNGDSLGRRHSGNPARRQEQSDFFKSFGASPRKRAENMISRVATSRIGIPGGVGADCGEIVTRGEHKAPASGSARAIASATGGARHRSSQMSLLAGSRAPL